MKQLHPKARWLFRLRAYVLLLLPTLWIVPMLITFFAIPAARGATILSGFLPHFLLSLFLYVFFIMGVGEIYARMSYQRWFYEFSADGLKTERGIIWKKYSTIPYQRIQNVDIHRGVIARVFGFSGIKIQTAGYSATSPLAHAEGDIPAVEQEEAERIREFLLKKIKSSSKSGV